MSTIFLVKRRIKVGDGEVSVVVRCESRKEDAYTFANQLQTAMVGMLECHLVKVGKDGEGDDTGVALGQFLADLGVFGFTLQVEEVPLEGRLIDLVGQMPSGTPVWRGRN